MPTPTDFSDWLQAELNKRNMKASDLANKARIDKGIISRAISRQRNPTPETLQAIARAFRIPVEETYRAAGLLPQQLEETIQIKELAFLASQLPDQELDDLIEYARLRLTLAEKRGTYETEQDK